ncbi:unnamed protein product [Alternaria burnsii]|nr:unnamed protein product [Alternaria burnsii]
MQCIQFTLHSSFPEYASSLLIACCGQNSDKQANDARKSAALQRRAVWKVEDAERTEQEKRDAVEKAASDQRTKKHEDAAISKAKVEEKEHVEQQAKQREDVFLAEEGDLV